MATLTFTITVPDGQDSNIVRDFAEAHGWTATIPDASGNQIPNPVTRAEWARKTLAKFIKNSIRGYRIEKAADTAALTEAAAVDALAIT